MREEHAGEEPNALSNTETLPPIPNAGPGGNAVVKAMVALAASAASQQSQDTLWV